MKHIWRKNFDIKRCDYQMPYPVLSLIFESQKKLLGKTYLTKGLWVQENGDNTGTYFPVHELRAYLQHTLALVLSRPNKIRALHKASIANNKKYFAEARRIEKRNLSACSNEELIRLYKRILSWQRIGHGQSLPTTWFLDSDGEIFSSYLLNFLQTQITALKRAENAAEVFSILTTPPHESLARAEEIALLKLTEALAADTVTWRLLEREPIETIARAWNRFSPSSQKLIMAHYKEWRWVPYTYNGPAYTLDYYVQVLAGLAREKIDVAEKLRGFAAQKNTVVREQKKYRRQLRITEPMWRYFTIAQEIIYLKGLRKDCLYRGGFARDLILKEVAKRVAATVMQVKYLTPDEVVTTLRRGTLDPHVVNERQKCSVLAMRRGKVTIYVGDRAHAFLAKHTFEKEVVQVASELRGTCACPGSAKGRVKIVNLPEEMSKMQVGDIMLAHTTFPSLVPAMKKAAAIVTEDGGITCHAAIVSRELKIPCIVGIKTLTKALQDGDMVEVDATGGVVKKID